jgi:hypothetical protein
MAGDDSRMAGGESRTTGDCCRPEGSIHRCVCTHSHLYSYIYGLVALLDNIQASLASLFQHGLPVCEDTPPVLNVCFFQQAMRETAKKL